MPEEDIYDAVYHEDEQEIYDDLCSLKLKPPQVQDCASALLLESASVLSYRLKQICVELCAKETSLKWLQLSCFSFSIT